MSRSLGVKKTVVGEKLNSKILGDLLCAIAVDIGNERGCLPLVDKIRRIKTKNLRQAHGTPLGLELNVLHVVTEFLRCSFELLLQGLGAKWDLG